MKKTNLKILFTALSFFALSSAFSQDTTSSVTSGDSTNVPQASPMATDSTSVNQNPAANQNPSGADSTSTKQPAKKKEE